MFRPLSSRLIAKNSNSIIRTTIYTTTYRQFSRTKAIMGVEKTIRQEGNGPVPKNGDQVTMEYTGWLKDASAPNQKGKQ
jgi:FKBP-type peptidyl-prolyl cis-trans isomerase